MLLSWLAQRWLGVGPPLDRHVTVERDVAVPVDDDIVLLADLYHPAGDGSHPTVLVRCPYGRRGPIGFFLGRIFAERGTHAVIQSCRGTFGSGGVFVPNFFERADGLATIAWLERQPWFDGHLAMNGPSYMGGVQWAVADSAGPSLKACCTHVAYSNITAHWYGSGTFALEDAIDWTTSIFVQEDGATRKLASLANPRLRRIDRAINTLPVDGLDQRVVGERVEQWRNIVEHPGRDDPHWGPVDHSGRVAHVDAAVLQVGGWYDLFLPQQLADRAALVAAGRPSRLVIGPWTHVAPGGFAAQIRESLRFVDRHCYEPPRGAGPASPVRVFVMGADTWRDLPDWPPPGAAEQRWHLHPGGRLAPDAPAPSDPDRYTYDPADPTPIVGGTLLRRTGGRRPQASTEARADVLVYTSDVLAADLDVIGPVHATVHVASDLDHFDVFVRLCDVDERGRSFNVCDGIFRVEPGRLTRPADGVWRVPVVLWPTAQRFAAGHRLRVQVAGGAHPRFNRNLGTGDPLPTATAHRVARQAVHHDPDHPSHVVLSVSA
ncbi:MAG TPA: CocE/NonD family hydrolase [Acidimicrobiia bacterium]|nr:CocE/NonD family hydrolase [Acidimicrobiia bacterium]